MGTSVARVNGSGDHPLLAVVGHVDEIALLVSHISDKGFLHVVGSGGWDPQVLVAQRVEVLTRTGPVRGVIGRKPIHVLEGEERKKAVELKSLHVDIGARDGDEARSLVREGDPIVITAEPVELRGDRIISRSLDNRLGIYVALEVARRVSEAGGGARPGRGGGRGAGGDRRARRPGDGLRAAAGPGHRGRRDPRYRRARRRRRRARRARARQRAGDHARSRRQPPTQRPDRRRGRVGWDRVHHRSRRQRHTHRRRLDPPQPHRRRRPRSSRSRCATCTRPSSWSSWPTWRRRSP